MKVFLDSVGCRLNQSEIERYARQFRAAGHTLVATAEEADLVVINTCAVTAAAASDSRQKIRQAERLGAGKIVVTGCWSALNPQMAASFPNVQKVVANLDKDNLVPIALDLPPEEFDLEPLEREPIPGGRARTRAFIKAQDGCDNRCTFCVTTIARGPGRSRPVETVLEDIHLALDGGAQEIVLTGVHLGSWGKDFAERTHLRDLVAEILAQTGAPRLRLSSLEPWDLDGAFFKLWQDARLCRHLHLPLQSGSAGTLRRMARKTTPASFAALIEAARKQIPDVAITTDLITGFPGESEAEFTESLEFVRSLGFAGGHVFTYSARPGTAAARMPEQVPHPLRRERNAQMRQILAESAQAYRQAFLGQELGVLWESAAELDPATWEMSGLTDNYLRVHLQAPRRIHNRITPVRLTAIAHDGMEGTLIL